MSRLNDNLIAAFGSGLAQSTPVPGGDINRAWRLTLNDGTRLFMKANRHADPLFFLAEAEGLAAIRATGAIGVPRVIARGTDERIGDYLLMEWIEAGRRSPAFWEDFGHALGAMHLSDSTAFKGHFGWDRDNYIGTTVQVNSPRDSWVSFFRDCRLVPQFRLADHWFDGSDRKRIAKLSDHLGDILVEPERPSLLHGDLWAGNHIIGSDGRAWLIDPAVYCGHAEADLAMTELFGGFPSAFYGAYRETNPLQPGYPERRDLYNLYHLLNHLNLFGSGYLSSVHRILRRYS